MDLEYMRMMGDDDPFDPINDPDTRRDFMTALAWSSVTPSAELLRGPVNEVLERAEADERDHTEDEWDLAVDQFKTVLRMKHAFIELAETYSGNIEDAPTYAMDVMLRQRPPEEDALEKMAEHRKQCHQRALEAFAEIFEIKTSEFAPYIASEDEGNDASPEEIWWNACVYSKGIFEKPDGEMVLMDAELNDAFWSVILDSRWMHRSASVDLGIFDRELA